MAEWPTTVAEARVVQESLRSQVICEDRFDKVERVAGADVGFEDGGNTTRAAVVVLNFPQLELLDQVVVRQPTRFPYVPGYLSFREAPAVIEAFRRLHHSPDLLVCDGQGIAHPRRFGLACHLGVLLDLPTIGVAKSRLTGTYTEPGPKKGDWSELRDGEECIGSVVRTRDNVKPVFVSCGHRVGNRSAVKLALACTGRYRLPETTRWAHRLASN
ncbi:MAG: endonuclease V [Acidithiobacillales bacterium SG8_45]|jgi:deoxyribonuclease V|nr:MAG: endonuclease V [Acidithiobacillales bacterium SG8_45]